MRSVIIVIALVLSLSPAVAQQSGFNQPGGGSSFGPITGDCTTVGNAITCTKSSGVAFGALATAAALTGDCTTSGAAATCTKTSGVAFGTAATANAGTLSGSGHVLPFLDVSNTWSQINQVYNNGLTVSSSLLLATGGVQLSGLSTGTNADFLCLSGTGVVLLQTSACTISSVRFKMDLRPLDRDALGMIADMMPVSFRMKPGDKPNADRNFAKPQLGLTAENIAAIDPRMAIYEPDGVTPKSYRQEAVIAVLVGAIKEQQREIEDLRAELRGKPR